MNQAGKRAMAGINCTLKTDDVCSEFLQNIVPVLEGVPSTSVISYVDTEGARPLTDDIEVLSESHSVFQLRVRNAAVSERDKGYAQGSKTRFASGGVEN